MTTTSLVVDLPTSPRFSAAAQSLARLRALGAAGLLCGVFLACLGFAWDVQWHTDVGPDTFFTAPHLVLYGGIAISGLTCRAVVLLTTRFTSGTGTALAGTTAIFNGTSRAPLDYIIGGFGALFFLLYGLMDQWWHSLYGFDVTLVSPPHVGLILSIMVTMAGCLIALAWHVRTASPRGAQRFLAALGTAFAAAVLLKIGRLRSWSPVVVVPIAGAVAALTLRLLEADLPLYQPSAFDPAEIAAFRAAHSSSVATSSLILAPIIGAVAGWFGWLLGVCGWLAVRPGRLPESRAWSPSGI